MSLVELNNLEFQVDTLLTNLEKTQLENQALRGQIANSNRDNWRLKERNQRAALRIKKILGQLKDEIT